MSLPSHTTLPCWVLDWGLRSTNNLTPPARTPRRMRAMPQVHWILSSMPALARRRMPQGAWLAHPQLIGADEGIVPWGGSITEHVGNSVGQRVDGWAFPCFERLQGRMLSPTEIGAARSKMPWSRATILLKWRRRCSHPWRGWPGTTLKWSMRMGTCMWRISWMDWTPCMECPWCSSHSTLPCVAYSRRRWNPPVPSTIVWCR